MDLHFRIVRLGSAGFIFVIGVSTRTNYPTIFAASVTSWLNSISILQVTLHTFLQMPNNVCKVVAGAALAYAFVVVVKCPCKDIVECYQMQFWGAMAVAALSIPFNNYLNHRPASFLTISAKV